MASNRSILLIDSSDHFNRSLKHTLLNQFSDASIKALRSDADIRRVLMQDSFDLIIADVHSLSVPARTFLKTISDEFIGTSVLFLSNTISKDSAIDLLESGAVDYIDKQCSNCIVLSCYKHFHLNKRQSTHSLSKELVEVVNLIQKSNIGELYIANLETFQFIYANQTLMNNLGYSDSHFRGLYLDDIIENLKTENLRNRIKYIESHDSDILSMSLNHVRKDGTKYPVNTYFKVFHQRNKHLLIGLSINLSRQQKDADELQKLRLTNKYKSEFIANISHEMRTTLNSIQILSKTLYENNADNLTQNQVKKTQVIQTATQDLIQLLNQVLDLKKIDSGKMEVNPGTVDIKQVAGQMEKLHLPMAHSKGITFNCEVHESVPETIITDRVRLLQILNNLISNAIKFTNEGQVRLNVTLKQKNNADGKILFTVSDTGIGIPKEKQKLVFESFTQAEEAKTSGEFGGTGLGLTISKQLSVLLKGAIKLNSNEGEGTSITLSLPLTLNEPSRNNALSIAENVHTPAKPISELNVLLVDDNTTHNLALNEFLRFHVKECISAESANEAYDILKKESVDVIILDMYLPDSNGEQVLNYLHQKDEYMNIPVIIYTGKNLSDKEKSSIEKVAAAVVEKNVNSYRTLVRTLNEIFG